MMRGGRRIGDERVESGGDGPGISTRLIFRQWLAELTLCWERCSCHFVIVKAHL